MLLICYGVIAFLTFAGSLWGIIHSAAQGHILGIIIWSFIGYGCCMVLDSLEQAFIKRGDKQL